MDSRLLRASGASLLQFAELLVLHFADDQVPENAANIRSRIGERVDQLRHEISWSEEVAVMPGDLGMIDQQIEDLATTPDVEMLVQLRVRSADHLARAIEHAGLRHAARLDVRNDDPVVRPDSFAVGVLERLDLVLDLAQQPLLLVRGCRRRMKFRLQVPRAAPAVGETRVWRFALEEDIASAIGAGREAGAARAEDFQGERVDEVLERIRSETRQVVWRGHF